MEHTVGLVYQSCDYHRDMEFDFLQEKANECIIGTASMHRLRPLHEARDGTLDAQVERLGR